MEAHFSIRNDIAIFHVTGQFGYGDEKRLVDIGIKVIDSGARILAVDTTKLDYVNSLGVAALFSMVRFADDNNCEFVIYGMNRNVEMVLQKVFEKDYVPLLTEEAFTSKYLS
ncbi:MAG TPA: STAS domain-containing protein [Spirochaetota bacterium]|nr:STAS domain-containing protein [Spirochaetota bacterium]HQP47775.1 STAS domain-containing protein [Spirochaetota bacterium]